MQYKKQLGTRGEQLVKKHLKKEGFSIVKTNFTCRAGEIDIIAHKKDLIVFIEVKTRKTPYFHLSEVINERKQKCIIRTAQTYLRIHQTQPSIIRFDVALLTIAHDAEQPTLCYIPNAFTQPELL